jgi:hypothetical protein
MARSAAERWRKQALPAISGDELPPVKRQEALHLRFERRIDGIAAADTLMDTERERRGAGLRVGFTAMFTPPQQPCLDCGGSLRFRNLGQGGQLASRPL